MKLPENYLMGAYHIFIKDYGKITIQEIILKLDIKVNSNHKNIGEILPPVDFCIIRNDEWLSIFNPAGWYYLYDKPQTQKIIKEITQKFEVFHCYFGDIDASFNFFYYKNGNLIRAYDYDEDPFDIDKNQVRKNIGEPLTIEKEAFSFKFEYDIVWTIAQSIGIDVSQKNKIIWHFLADDGIQSY